MPRKTHRRVLERTSGCCFNEAAARCHGKLVRHLCDSVSGVASMRPRPDATENSVIIIMT